MCCAPSPADNGRDLPLPFHLASPGDGERQRSVPLLWDLDFICVLLARNFFLSNLAKDLGMRSLPRNYGFLVQLLVTSLHKSSRRHRGQQLR